MVAASFLLVASLSNAQAYPNWASPQQIAAAAAEQREWTLKTAEAAKNCLPAEVLMSHFRIVREAWVGRNAYFSPSFIGREAWRIYADQHPGASAREFPLRGTVFFCVTDAPVAPKWANAASSVTAELVAALGVLILAPSMMATFWEARRRRFGGTTELLWLLVPLDILGVYLNLLFL